MNTLPSAVRIVEVGPRDGLQNESVRLSTETKIKLIESLANAGLREVESGAFVSPKWVPQMADSAAILQGITRSKGVSYPVLVPNFYGYQQAQQAGAKHVAIFISASESFSQKNTNCSIDKALQRAQTIIHQAEIDKIPVRGYLSCVVDCPYEGPIPPLQTAHYARALYELGVNEISLGDTIGTATPVRTANMIAAVQKHIPSAQLAVHFHDTYGQALTNTYVALSMGITTIDSAIGGLGGCPYAKGASGNLATEDLIYMLNGLGIHTGVDLEALCTISAWLANEHGMPIRSKTALASINLHSGS